MLENQYLVIVNQTTHYYVRCTEKVIQSWWSTMTDAGHNIRCTEVKLSELDEISHNHFC